jgi:ketosteroid isomerase-like protein
MTSREKVELVERAARAVMARPEPDYAALRELAHPDHVLVPAGAPTGLEQIARGEAGLREWHRTVQAMIPAEFELEGAVDVGADKVLTVSLARFQGASSGAGGEQRLWSVITVRDDRIMRTESYTDPESALRSALGDTASRHEDR